MTTVRIPLKISAASLQALAVWVALAVATVGCEEKKTQSRACEPKLAPVDDAGKPVESLAERHLRKTMQPATLQAFDDYTRSLPPIVATVAGLPITRERVRAEIMRFSPSGLPPGAAQRRALVDRAIGFAADGLRVKSAVDAAGLATKVHDEVASAMRQKRGAHPTRAIYEREMAKYRLSPASHRWIWYRRIGLRALARHHGAADIPDSEVRARFEKNPTALTDTDGNPMPYGFAAPFLRDIIINERLREESRREWEQLRMNIEVEVLLADSATGT